MGDNGKQELIYAVVMDTAGRKFIGRVEVDALEDWRQGVNDTVSLHEPIQMQEKAVASGDGNIRMEIHTYPLDPVDVGIETYHMCPSGYYYPSEGSHKLKALHEKRWSELRQIATGIVRPTGLVRS